MVPLHPCSLVARGVSRLYTFPCCRWIVWGYVEGKRDGLIQTSSPSFLSANIDHRTSFRADHSNFCSRSSRANSKLLPLFDAVIPCTRLILSFTLVLVPANLKNSVGASFHTRGAVAPPRLITFICTSSITSIEATGMPACMIPAAAEAASRMVGKLTTATDVSSGTMASLRVARLSTYSSDSHLRPLVWIHSHAPSVTKPSVPSLPTNMPLRLYPAELFLGRLLVLMTVPSARTTVRLITQSFIVPYLTALVPEQFVPIIPPILALGPSYLKLRSASPSAFISLG